jgi:predicted unusual protein kinase regulating ubiquinone biosynthesis (AarF/ABC1/UbiB family)
MVSVVASTSRLTQGRAYYAELRETLLDELDYRQEAVRAKQFAAAAAPLKTLKVPRVYDELTHEKVLTLELLPGRTVKELLNHLDEATPAQRFAASRLLIHAIWGPFFLTGLVHADPHPGNYLLLEDGRLGVLDFGAVKQISAGWTDVNRRMFRDLCAGRAFDVLALSLESGFSFDDHAEARPFVQGIIDLAARPLRGRDFDFKSAFISRDMRNHFLKHATKLKGMRPPKESVQFFRAVGGLEQNLENLGARGDFLAVWEELLALAP